MILQPGDIIMVHRYPPYGIQDIPAPFIRVITGCYWNHVATVGPCLGKLYIFEAIGKGFVPTMKVEDYLNQVGNVREIAVMRPKPDLFYTPEEFFEGIDDLINRGYDFKSLLWYQIWYQLTGRWKGKTGDASSKTIYCSEAIAYGYRRIFPEPWLVYPKKIWEEPKLEMIWESARISRLKWEDKWIR